MASAAKRGRNHRRMLDTIKTVPAFIAVTGAIVAFAIAALVVGTAVMLAGRVAFVWHRAERPVADVLRGTTALLRIDGPRQIVGNGCFAIGALIESRGVVAHLDRVETLHLEARVHVATEQEILRWVAEQGLQDRPTVPPHVDRDFADPKAMRRTIDWARTGPWNEAQSYVR